MTKVNVYGKNGKVKESMNLPTYFNTPYRPDLIRKNFNVLHSNKRAPYGVSLLAGRQHATASVGKGRGASRVPRLTQGNRAALAPCVVGGRRAHPPRADRVWKEKINKKEKKLAQASAIAAISSKDIVKGRGHQFNEEVTLPIILDDECETIIKTKDIIAIFKEIGIYDDIIRSTNGKHIRAGKGKLRGRKYKTPKSVLLVSNSESLQKSVMNLSGVDTTTPIDLNIEHLAPGGDAGRLTVITKSALEQIGGRY